MELQKITAEFTDESMNKLISKLKRLYNNQQSDFSNLCYTIYQIDCWFEDNKDCVLRMKMTSDYYNKKQLFKMLGINNRTRQRYSNCYLKFMTLKQESDDVVAKIKEPFESFAPSKLIELLPISTEKLLQLIENKQISSEMTVKQLRDFFAASEKKELLEDMSDEEMEEECVAGEFEDNFLLLPNDTARLDFLESYRTWGLWFEEKRLGLKYYRCKIGKKTLVAVLSQYELPTKEVMDSVSYYYMNSLGCLDINPVSKTQLMENIRHTEQSKVVLFER